MEDFMPMWRSFLVLALSSFLFAACTLSSIGTQPDLQLPQGTLTAAEVTALFSGKTVESVLDSTGRTSLTYYNPNGELRQLQNGERRNGHWRVRDDGRICLQFEGDSEDKCRIIVREGEVYRKYIVKLNGQHQPIITYKAFRFGNLVD